MEWWCFIFFINNSLWVCYLIWVYDEDDDGYFFEVVSIEDLFLFNFDKWWIKLGGVDFYCVYIFIIVRDCFVF